MISPKFLSSVASLTPPGGHPGGISTSTIQKQLWGSTLAPLPVISNLLPLVKAQILGPS